MAGTPKGSLTTQHYPQEGFSQPLCDIFPSPTNTQPVPCSPLANPAAHLRKLPRHQHCGANGEKHKHLLPRQQAAVGFWSRPPQKGHFPPCHGSGRCHISTRRGRRRTRRGQMRFARTSYGHTKRRGFVLFADFYSHFYSPFLFYAANFRT